PEDEKYPATTTSTKEIPQVNDEARTNIEKLINIHKRRLHVLEEQSAHYGASVDPAIPIEIEDITEKISQLEAQLAQGGSSQPKKSPPPLNPVPLHQQANTRDQIFISYSHADKRWLDRLMIHLRPLVRDDNLKVW